MKPKEVKGNFAVTDLALAPNIPNQIAAIEKAIEMMNEGHQMLRDADKLMETTFGRGTSSHGMTTWNISGDWPQHPETKMEEAVERRIRNSAWRVIIEQLGIRQLLTIKAAEVLDKQLKTGYLQLGGYEWGTHVYKPAIPFPELTVENVFNFLEAIVDQSGSMVEDVCKEVFDLLRPGIKDMENWNTKQLKTNRKNAWRVGDRVIMKGWIRKGTYEPDIDYRKNEYIMLDKVFHLLDGKKQSEIWCGDLANSISQSAVSEGETEYFKWKAHLNGRLHIQFKRMDIVERLNQFAVGSTDLPDKEM